MGEFFLSSGFLWGLGAASAPIIIHLLARRRYRRVQWAAMEFLRRAMRKTQRRLKLENLLLLLLRTAAVVLLALALARPVLTPIPVIAELGTQERTVLLAIDRSASMAARGEGTPPFQRARAMAMEIIDSLRARDEIYLLWVGDRVDPVFDGPTPEKQRAREEIEGATPWDGGTRWAPALANLAEVLARPEVKAREVRAVYCITDLQRTGWEITGDGSSGGVREGLTQLGQLAQEVVVLDVGTTDRANLGVVDVQLGDRVVSHKRPTRVRAAVRNFGEQDAVEAPVSLVIGGSKHKTKTLSLAPGETRTVDFYVSFTDPGAQRVSVELDPDALDRDNRRDLAVHVRAEVQVLVVDGDPGEHERYEHAAELLRYQLAPGGDGEHGDTVVKPIARDHSQLPSLRLEDYDCVVLADANETVTTPAVAQMLATYVREGGALLVIPGDNVLPADYARAFWDPPRDGAADFEPLLPARLGPVQTVVHPGDRIDQGLVLQPESWQHPIFRKFDDDQWRRLIAVNARVKKFFTIDGALADGARVLARFSDMAQTPALIERTVGAGRVLLLTTGWARSWGQYHAQPGGLILANEMVLHLARDPAEGRTVPLGSPLTWVIDAADYADQVQVLLPHGGRKGLDPPRADGERFVVQMRDTRNVGFHEIELQPTGGAGRSALFAVVGDPLEGDLTAVPHAELVAGLPAPANERVRVERAFRTSEHVASTSAREVWRACIWLLLLVLLSESLLARRLGKRGT